MQQTLSLESILTLTQDKMQQLLQVLKTETLILEKNNIKELEKITLEKTSITEEIEKNEQQRIHFLNENTLNPNEPATWLSNNKLISTWRDIRTLSEQAQKQNKINGMVIHGNRRRIKTKIEILSTSAPETELIYSSSGKNINQKNSKILAHA